MNANINTMDLPVAWCERCGKRLLLQEPLKTVGYSEYTGEPILEVALSCPQERWFNSHTKRWFRRGESIFKDKWCLVMEGM